MKMLNVIPVAAIALSCTMISFPINSAEGMGPGMGGGRGGGAVGFSGGGGRTGGGVASRGGAMASRGAFVGSRGAMVGNRAAVAASRGAFAGGRNAYVGNQNAFIGNRSGFVPGGRGRGAQVRGALPVAATTTAGFAGARVASQGAFAANPAFVGESFAEGRGFRSDRRFDRRSERRSDRFDRRSDWRRSQRFDRLAQVRRAIPLYYYGFNFYPSYGFNLFDSAPVTVDANGNPFNNRFVTSQQAVRVPGAILPVAGAPRTVEVQLALRNRGFYGGPIDGFIGAQSRGAIRAFQYAYGLPVNGQIDSRMFTVLMRGF